MAWLQKQRKGYNTSVQSSHARCKSLCCSSHQRRFLIFWMLSTNVNRITSEHCFGVQSLLPTTHSRTGQQYLTTSISTGKTHYFLALIILMRYDAQGTLTQLLINQWATLFLHLLKSHKIWPLQACIENVHMTRWTHTMTDHGKSQEFWTT